MGKWQPIETALEYLQNNTAFEDILLWSCGRSVYPGWLYGGKWYDSRNPDHDDPPEDPQPTHWMPKRPTEPVPDPPDA